MSFDIEQTLQGMAGAMTDAVKSDIGDIQQYAKTILLSEKNSLKELGEARIRGDIDDDDFNNELEREKMVVKAELLAIQIMTEAAAQKAINAAIDFFVDAVKAALPIPG